MQRSTGGRRVGIHGYSFEQNPGPGRLYTIGGPDRAGKSTIGKALAQRLGLVFLRYDSMLDSYLGDLRVASRSRALKQVQVDLLNSGAVHQEPALYEYIITAICYETQRAVLLPVLREGTSILLDRWWHDALVYGQVQGLHRDFIIAMKQHLIIPDATLLITRDGCLPGREEKQDTYDSEAFQRGVRKSYEWLNTWWKRELHHICPIAMLKLPMDMDQETSLRRAEDAFRRLLKEVTAYA